MHGMVYEAFFSFRLGKEGRKDGRVEKWKGRRKGKKKERQSK